LVVGSIPTAGANFQASRCSNSLFCKHLLFYNSKECTNWYTNLKDITSLNEVKHTILVNKSQRMFGGIIADHGWLFA
jgi:hypothetical protein